MFWRLDGSAIGNANPGDSRESIDSQKSLSFHNWAVANGGVTNGGLRGVWPPFPEIGRKSAFFAPFLPFSAKAFFLQISSDLLK